MTAAMLSSLLLKGLASFLAEYVVIAGIVFLVARALSKRVPSRFFIRPSTPRAQQVGREIFNSLRSVAIFVACYIGLTWCFHALFPAVYAYRQHLSWLSAPSLLVTVVTVGVGLLAHDAYFYWTHKLMHARRFQWLGHSEHHRSHQPTAWAGYSFSPAEAFIQAAFFPIFLFAVPSRPETAIGLAVIALILNCMGHSGVELFPRGIVSDPRFGWLTGTTHHDIHHAASRSNYGLYFRIWDRLMGTEDRSFLKVYAFVRSPENDGHAYERFLR